MPTRAALALVLLLAGCAKDTWSGGPGDPAQFQRDDYECQRDAAMLPRTPQAATRGAYGVVTYSDPSMGLFDLAARKNMLRACLESKGYHRVK